MKKVRVGLVGAGFAGHIHSRALILVKGSRLADKVKVELVVVADIDINRARATANQYGWQKTEKLAVDVFKHNIDLLVVALPNNEHVKIVKRAIDEDIAVLLEKPVARTHKESLDIMRFAKSDSIIRVAYVNRFVPATQ